MHDGSDIEFERLLSPEDVARVCGLSRRAVYRAIERGSFGPYESATGCESVQRSWSAGLVAR